MTKLINIRKCKVLRIINILASKSEVFGLKSGESFTTSDFEKTTSEVILTTSDLVLTTFEVVFAIFGPKKRGNRVASPSVVQIYNIFERNPNFDFFRNAEILTFRTFYRGVVG